MPCNKLFFDSRCSKLFEMCLYHVVQLSLLFATRTILAKTTSLPSPRFDCFPEDNATERLCIKRGCLWSEIIPKCYYPSDYGYVLDGEIESSSNGYTALIKQRYPSYYDTSPIPEVRVNIYEETQHRMRIKFTDENAKNSRYEVPIDLPSIPSTKPTNTQHDILFNSDIFGFNIHRKSNSQSIINTAMPGFIYSDQFISISMSIGNHSKIYGFGERFSDLLIDLNHTTVSLFSRDIWNSYPSLNSGYGVHPFGLFVDESNGDSFGLFFVNSNAMEFAFTPDPSLQFRTIGGILDFYVFLGPKPLDVVRQYHELIGFTFFPPYWSFGFHLCRWGYLTLNKTKQIVANMRNAKIPYDVQWLDIDYMDNYKVFTFDNESFDGLPQFIEEELHQQYDMKFIQIIDPGISTAPYDTFTNGIANDVFIKSKNHSLYTGKVWPGGTVFPDYFAPNTVDWWMDEVQKWYEKIKFDGFWIDMNEPSNFGGDLCSNNTFDNSPYFPKGLETDDIDDPFGCGQHTVCMNTIQSYRNTSVTEHYNVHSLYGYSMMRATHKALSVLHQRPFIISRSTFASSGQYGGKWHGDNNAQFDHLKQSISAMIMFSMFGLPMNGADICGFFGNASVELCSRWIEIGAFYPFARNHNAISSVFNTTDQDPPSLGAQVVEIHRKYLTMRYSFLPLLYSLFYKAHAKGLNVINALFMVWFDDTNTYDINEQYLWSDVLLFSPATYGGQRTVNAYLPPMQPNKTLQERWFNVENGEEVPQNGWNMEMDTPLDKTHIHMRGGCIMVLQNINTNDEMPVLTTVEARKRAYKLVIALDAEYSAFGDVFIDDGVSNEYQTQNMFDFVEFEFAENRLLTNVVRNDSFDNAMANDGLLNEIAVFGMDLDINQFALNVNDHNYIHFEYDSEFNVFKIVGLKLKIDESFTIEFVHKKHKSEL
eukprot:810222_1